MSPAKKKPTGDPSIARYQGLTARVCGLLGIQPVAGSEEALYELQFKALSDWCAEKQKENLEMKQMFGE